ncbi:hypothetical protein Tco_0512595 [Tanacetum coccineum]
MTPTPIANKRRKSKEVTGESSTSRKSLKVIVKQKKPSTTLIPPPSDDRERDEIAEATLLSLTMHKTAIIAEAQENVVKVQEKILEEYIDKMIDGRALIDGEDEDSYASAFADSDFQDEEDIGTRIEPRSRKENPKTVDDDEDDVVQENKDDVKDDDENNNDNDDHE